jgi:hypothetical protein
VLIDDPDRSVIEPVSRATGMSEPVYAGDLMLGGGSIEAFRPDSALLIEQFSESMERLADPARFEERYGSRDPFFIAVGDGNHSLAAAKSLWEDLKSRLEPRIRNSHPARYAMVEAVNLYDEGMIFEPIHRLLFDVDSRAALEFCRKRAGGEFTETDALEDITDAVTSGPRGGVIGFLSEGEQGILTLGSNSGHRNAKLIQDAIDELLDERGGGIDYIHDLPTLLSQGRLRGNAAFIMPGIDKSRFFKYIIENGSFPRKSFSLGSSKEKRYYLEARRIVP